MPNGTDFERQFRGNLAHRAMLIMIEIIRNEWGWTGLDPVAVIASNAFGNVIVRAVDGAY